MNKSDLIEALGKDLQTLTKEFIALTKKMGQLTTKLDVVNQMDLPIIRDPASQ
jgi:hypothetical protein